eukprot:10734589-Alexandrium_andersonii.AAC.1
MRSLHRQNGGLWMGGCLLPWAALDSKSIDGTIRSCMGTLRTAVRSLDRHCARGACPWTRSA